MKRIPEKEIARAVRSELIRQSALAMGRTAPNPAVGCVLVVSEPGESARRLVSGGTERAGGRHAEIVALDAYDAYRRGREIERVCMHVTLEPCSSRGRTGPCTERIVRYPELDRVVVHARDTTLAASGIARLDAAGIPCVLAGDDGIPRAFLGGFMGTSRGARPRFHLKAAITSDGRMSGAPPSRLMISGSTARRFTMLLRAKLDAVLVGPGTVACDLPGLDLRLPDASPSNDLTANGSSSSDLPSSTSSSSDLPSRDWDAMRAEKLEGSDIFCEALFAHAPSIEELARNQIEYQPLRVFLMGRPFARQAEFLEMQRRLGERTGKAPLFLDDSAIASSLRAELGRRGQNEVLIEGGKALFDALRTELLPGDRVYLLQNKRPLEKGEGKRIPDWLLDLPQSARFDLEEDILIVKEI